MFERVVDSIRGLRAGWRRERSIRAHVLLSATGVGVLIFSQPATSWFLAFGILLVVGLAAEFMNAAIEALLDRLHPDLHPAIGTAKDMSSAAAFIVNIAAAAVFCTALVR